MFSNINKLFDTPQPIQFTSRLPITECANRLQESIGKPMGCLNSPIKGQVEKLDETTYEFTLYQAHRGGHRLAGHLYTQTKSSTLIDALHTVDRTSWFAGILFIIVMIVIAFIVEMPKNGLANAFWFSVILLALTGGIIFVSVKAQSISQLVWYIERTLKN